MLKTSTLGRRGLLAGALGLLTTPLFAACGGLAQVVATVGGDPITLAEVQSEVQRRQAAASGAAADVGQLQEGVIDYLINLRVMRRYAAANGLQVTEADVDAWIARLTKEQANSSALRDVLRGEGMTGTLFRQNVSDVILRERLTAAHVPNPTTIEERRVRHLLLPTAEAAAAARARLVAGEAWAAVALAVSQDPSVRTNGGDLGFVKRGQTVPAFDEAAFTARIGELSPPVRSNFGFHIIEVTEARAVAPTPAEAAAWREQAFIRWLRAERAKMAVVRHGAGPTP